MNIEPRDSERLSARISTLGASPKTAPGVAAALGITALLLLSACHTTAGAGEDISAAGHAISHSATEHAPY